MVDEDCTNLNFFPRNSPDDVFVKYFKNGNQAIGGQTVGNLISSIGGGHSVSFSFDMELMPGDVIDVSVNLLTGGPLQIFGGTSLGSTFSGYKVN